MLLNDEALRAVQDALNIGQEMRRRQKRYFVLRQPSALQEAKDAERRFDAALDDAIYALAHNAPKPKQGDLFGGEA